VLQLLPLLAALCSLVVIRLLKLCLVATQVVVPKGCTTHSNQAYLLELNLELQKLGKRLLKIG
jgi:hypothetical protein